MRLSLIFLLTLSVVFVSGCTSTRKQNDEFGTALYKAFTEPFAPIYDISMMRSGAIDLLYCSGSFRHKHGRWPNDYTELSEFVKQSDGYLVIGEYERVALKPLPNDGLEVCYVRPGHTNEIKFTLGDVLQKK